MENLKKYHQNDVFFSHGYVSLQECRSVFLVLSNYQKMTLRKSNMEAKKCLLEKGENHLQTASFGFHDTFFGGAY